MNSGKIAKNTFFLYLRMLITMAISLYTSRVVLEVLGISDFGIYNVVGGVVAALGFLNGALSTASSRFITVALGTKNFQEMRLTFSSILLVNILLSLIVLILGETFGLYLLYNTLRIPVERLDIVFWVYQISMATVVLNIISVPYNAVIIAHERMRAFAFISLFDAASKLLLVILLSYIANFDKLLLYALFIFVIQVIIRAIYGYYCNKNFLESHISKDFSKQHIHKIFRFISWSAYGSIVSVGFTQGLNILLNIFFGTVVNAARGISVQVQNAVEQFTLNFQTAINPQMIKSFVDKDLETTRRLMIASSKYSFFLLSILGIPIIIEANFILTIWLKNIPNHAVNFVQLMLLITIWGSLANPLRIINQAEGNIKKFQLYECTLLLAIVPLSYLSVKLTHVAESVFIVHLVIEIITQFVRIGLVLPKVGMKFFQYLKLVYFKAIPIFLLPFTIIFPLRYLMDESIARFLIVVLTSELTVFALIYLVGIDAAEKLFIREKMAALISRKNG
jgi:O-antigen/teichoic acid export membrane protein